MLAYPQPGNFPCKILSSTISVNEPDSVRAQKLQDFLDDGVSSHDGTNTSTNLLRDCPLSNILCSKLFLRTANISPIKVMSGLLVKSLSSEIIAVGDLVRGKFREEDSDDCEKKEDLVPPTTIAKK